MGDLALFYACAADPLAMKVIAARSTRRDIESEALLPEQIAAARRALQRDEEDMAILRRLVDAGI